MYRMKSKDKPTEVKPTPTPVSKPTPCSKEIKEYQECLESFSYYFTSCRKQQEALKMSPEFNSWLEQAVKTKKQEPALHFK